MFGLTVKNKSEMFEMICKVAFLQNTNVNNLDLKELGYESYTELYHKLQNEGLNEEIIYLTSDLDESLDKVIYNVVADMEALIDFIID